MAQKRKIITEYIYQIKEDMPGTCIHQRAEDIIRGYNCKYFTVPKSETEPIFCKLLNIETTPNCFCCWAKRRNWPKDFWHGNGFVKIE